MSYGVCVHFFPLPAACSVKESYPPMHGIWFSCLGGFNSHSSIKRGESKAFRLINSPPLTDCLDSLSHRRNVILSLFYRYFHADCSSEFANCIPSPLPRARCTRLSTSSHPYSVHLPNASIFHFFIPYTGKIWNSLPLSVFPPAYDLKSLKRGVSRHL